MKKILSLIILSLISQNAIVNAETRDNPFMPNVIKKPEPQPVPIQAPPQVPAVQHRLPDLPMPPKMSEEELKREIEQDVSKNKMFLDGLSVLSISPRGAILRYSRQGGAGAGMSSAGGAGGAMSMEPQSPIKRMLVKNNQKIYMEGKEMVVKIDDLNVTLNIPNPANKKQLIPVWIGEIENFRFSYPMQMQQQQTLPPISSGSGVVSNSSSGGGSGSSGGSIGGGSGGGANPATGGQ